MSEYICKENRYLLGFKDFRPVYMTMSAWECGWYWSFGTLGSKSEYYPLSGYRNGRNISMYDALKLDYDLCEALRDDATLWKFCELATSVYTLKNTAELYGRGGSHITENPLSSLIRNEAESVRINDVVLPAIFTEIESIFIKKDLTPTIKPDTI